MSASFSLSPEDRGLLSEGLELLEKSLTDFILQEEDWITQARYAGTPSKVRHEAMELSQQKRQKLTDAVNLHNKIKVV